MLYGFMEILIALYPYLKAAHIIALIAWLAGLFYLPRLFVYHVETDPQDINPSATLVIWQERLLKRIMTPAMLATLILGFLLLMIPGLVDFGQGWIWVKLICVTLLVAFHFFLATQRKLLARNIHPYSGRTYRLLNEIPIILLIIIVLMVILRPF